jgi:hypothetical protein
MADRLQLDSYPAVMIEGTGIKLFLSLPKEVSETFSKQLDIPKRIKLLRRSALQREDSEEVFTLDYQPAGADELEHPVIIVLSYLFTGKSKPDKGAWFLAIVPNEDKEKFQQYLASTGKQIFANLQQDRALPFHIWTRHGPEYPASYEEVFSAVAKYIQEKRRLEWDQHTIIKIPLLFARQSGLVAWAQHEARERLKSTLRNSYTLRNFQEFVLQDMAQRTARPQPKIQFFNEVAEWIRIDPLLNTDKLGRYLQNIGYVDHPYKRLLCLYYDRCCLGAPLEFWIAECSSRFLRVAANALKLPPGDPLNAPLIRHWLSPLQLKSAQPPIVTKFNPQTGEMRINMDAAKLHGMAELLQHL